MPSQFDRTLSQFLESIEGEPKQRVWVAPDGKEHKVSPTNEQIDKEAQVAHNRLNPHLDRWIMLNEGDSKQKMFDAYDNLQDISKAALSFQAEDVVAGDGYLTAYRAMREGDSPSDIKGKSLTTSKEYVDTVGDSMGSVGVEKFRVHHSDILVMAGMKGTRIGTPEMFGYEDEVIIKN